MKKRDPALTCSNPHLLAAVYFGLLSVVGTILTNAFLSAIGIREIIPAFQAILLGMVVSSITGAICGDMIIHCPKPYKLKTFLIGFFMVIISLPVFDLGFMFLMNDENKSLISLGHVPYSLYFYFTILAYSYLLFGMFLAIASGLAAMYLRGQLVYDLLGTYQPDDNPEKMPDSPLEKNKIEHADKVRITHK